MINIEMNDGELSLSIKNLHRSFYKNAKCEPSFLEFQSHNVVIDADGELYLNDGSCSVGLKKNKDGKFVKRGVEGFTRQEIEEGKMHGEEGKIHGKEIQLNLQIYDALKRKALLQLKIMAK